MVELVEYMGGDHSVIECARISHKSTSTPEGDRRLIALLIDKGHMTPFESVTMRFKVRLPIFVARQWMRHRTAFHETSMRYCEPSKVAFIPEDCSEDAKRFFKKHFEESFKVYEQLINMGVKKERARIVLPLATFTEFFWTVDARKLMHFLELRLAKDAQKEIREYAVALLELFKVVAPITHEIFVQDLCDRGIFKPVKLEEVFEVHYPRRGEK